MLYFEEIAFIIEGKRLHSKGKMDEVEADIERMTLNNIYSILGETGAALPKKIYGIVICEVWSSKTAVWWKSLNENLRLGWPHENLSQAIQRDSFQLNYSVSNHELFWCYAIKEILN